MDGKPVETGQDRVYILLNKPPGYTSTRFDRFAEHTVLDLVSGIGGYLYPVGRLDVDTSGLIILTNDGDLAELLTHPSHEIEKTYAAVVPGRITARELTQLESGVELDDGMTAPARARLIAYNAEGDRSTVELKIHEGRKRQVKRMLAAIGYKVEKLTRTHLGHLDLRGVPEGEHRFLSKKEVAELRKLDEKSD